MGKNLKNLIKKKLVTHKALALDRFLEFDPRKPEDVVDFHKYRLLYQLNELMLKNNISKSRLAKSLGISRQAVTNKFLGEPLTLDWIVRAFAALGIGLEMKRTSSREIPAL